MDRIKALVYLKRYWPGVCCRARSKGESTFYSFDFASELLSSPGTLTLRSIIGTNHQSTRICMCLIVSKQVECRCAKPISGYFVRAPLVKRGFISYKILLSAPHIRLLYPKHGNMCEPNSISRLNYNIRAFCFQLDPCLCSPTPPNDKAASWEPKPTVAGHASAEKSNVTMHIQNVLDAKKQG